MLRTLPADFWRLWFVGMVISTVRWLETVAVAITARANHGVLQFSSPNNPYTTPRRISISH